jgi:hypothetical protein
MILRSTLLAIGAASLATACNPDSNTEATDTETVDPVQPDPATQTPAPPPEPAPLGEELDGTQAVTLELPRSILQHTMSFALVSEPGQPNDNYTDTTPAMPMISPGLNMALDGETYLFTVTTQDDERHRINAGTPTERTKVKLINTEGGGVLTVNGEVVWSGDQVKPMKDATFGKGYRERYWSGTVYDKVACVTPPEATFEATLADPGLATCDGDEG